ncbi:serine/threonine-protein kinase [Aporhodopirellula aestuarii]|uniref:Serine/threonine protein kinase n=1 Tax=Aporhodopirellula aestuarii TaxID=2950107 RepID=A0ABT0UCI9_9BACT|nr:serine/threonine-protein kinase [Aporhodopirellula aestuarii]MCM2374737.1 serine/threonine protein kinase [Aporhodopirellula aestuarii]
MTMAARATRIVPELLTENLRVTAKLRLVMPDNEPSRRLRAGTRLDKYRLVRRLGEGGFAVVFQAHDTIEDRSVALKLPDLTNDALSQSFDDVQREVRIMAGLSHPNVLPLKDARYIDGQFVMVFPLGEESLHDRLCRRLSRVTAVDYIRQMTASLAHAHENNVLHRDLKPENFILFPGNRICLTDFGLARNQTRRHAVSASGTLGYIAPEQAMGKPTFRSDVFALGLIVYRMLAGALPEYPFEPPLPSYAKFRKGLNQDFVDWVRKAIHPTPSKRFRDGVAMHNALERIRSVITDKSTASKSARRSTRRAA